MTINPTFITLLPKIGHTCPPHPYNNLPPPPSSVTIYSPTIVKKGWVLRMKILAQNHDNLGQTELAIVQLCFVLFSTLFL